MDIKRRRRAGDRAKINVYVDPEIEELYRIGRMNCWDTPGLVREAVTKALRAQENKLKSQPEDKSA